MRSLKCPWCNEYWPKAEDYEKCPTCHEDTQPTMVAPIDSALAASVKRERDFGWWLWETGRL